MIRTKFIGALLCWLTGFYPCMAVMHIACVGDSITAGFGLSNPSVDSYPARLQLLLGTGGFLVSNYGSSGTTLLTNGDDPYIQSGQWAASTNSHPDVVVIMLGANDSKPNGNSSKLSSFSSDYQWMIGVYGNIVLSSGTHPRIILCTPPPVFGTGAYSIDPLVVSNTISPDVRTVAASNNLQLIDMQTLLAGHPEWTQDNVHPNQQGTAVMAAIVYTAIQGDTMAGTRPSLGLHYLSVRTTVLNWPAAGAGWVLQKAPHLTNTWTIPLFPAINNIGSSTIQLTNISGDLFFRLWNPSVASR